MISKLFLLAGVLLCPMVQAQWTVLPGSPQAYMSPKIMTGLAGSRYAVVYTSPATRNMMISDYQVDFQKKALLNPEIRNLGGSFVTGPNCEYNLTLLAGICTGVKAGGVITASQVYENGQRIQTKWVDEYAGATALPYFAAYGGWPAQVVYRGPDNHVFAIEYTYDQTLGAWKSAGKRYQYLGGVITSAPECFSYQGSSSVSGNICAAIGSDGRLWAIDYTYASGSGKWSGWYPLSDSTEFDPSSKISMTGARNTYLPGVSYLKFYARSKTGKLLANAVHITQSGWPAGSTTLKGYKLDYAQWKVLDAQIAPGTAPSCMDSGTFLQDVCVYTGADSKIYYKMGINPSTL